MKEIEGKLSAKGLKIALVASRFNSFLVEQLVKGAADAFNRLGGDAAGLVLVRVPGAYEIPVTAKKLAASKKFDAVVGLGAVVQGATAHAALINETTSRAFTEIALETGVPVVDGVVSAENLEQAVERCGTFLTAGGLAPCLSSSIGFLIDAYTKKAPDVEMIGYINGYMGLLKGESIPVTPEVRKNALLLTQHGGSPIGNSRVKLTNVKDCVKRGLVKEGEDPLKVAADQLVKDGVDVLHTIGGDDTNTTAADLAAYLAKNNYKLIVVGLPKTIDNDVYPIKQSLGAYTAAEEGAQFFANVVKENSANPRSLIIHEVMGRNCGWLTAFTAIYYTKLLKRRIKFLPEFGLTRERQSIHAVYVPESRINFQSEAERLRKVMDKYDCVNIFVSEGACVKEIIKEMKKRGEDVPSGSRSASASFWARRRPRCSRAATTPARPRRARRTSN